MLISWKYSYLQRKTAEINWHSRVSCQVKIVKLKSDPCRNWVARDTCQRWYTCFLGTVQSAKRSTGNSLKKNALEVLQVTSPKIKKASSGAGIVRMSSPVFGKLSSMEISFRQLIFNCTSVACSLNYRNKPRATSVCIFSKNQSTSCIHVHLLLLVTYAWA